MATCQPTEQREGTQHCERRAPGHDVDQSDGTEVCNTEGTMTPDSVVIAGRQCPRSFAEKHVLLRSHGPDPEGEQRATEREQ